MVYLYDTDTEIGHATSSELIVALGRRTDESVEHINSRLQEDYQSVPYSKLIFNDGKTAYAPSKAVENMRAKLAEADVRVGAGRMLPDLAAALEDIQFSLSMAARTKSNAAVILREACIRYIAGKVAGSVSRKAGSDVLTSGQLEQRLAHIRPPQ